MGRRAHRPDERGRRQVEALAAYGVPEHHIARVVGIDPKTLRKHYRNELDLGATKATAKVADAAGLTLSPVSEEQSVTDVLAKVESGEADAGIVYVTDVRAAGDAVEGIPFPEAAEAVNLYPIATVKDSEHADLAGEFVDLVLSSAGQDTLRSAGFAPAP